MHFPLYKVYIDRGAGSRATGYNGGAAFGVSFYRIFNVPKAIVRAVCKTLAAPFPMQIQVPKR